MHTADVAVVGAGIIGASVASHLLEQARLRVLVIDRAAYAGAGATGRATGGIRHQFSTAAHIRLTQRSILEFTSFKERFGVDIEFEPVGYLFFTGHPSHLEKLREAVVLQNRFGVPTELLGVQDLAHRFSFLGTDDLIGGTFCGIDGAANPYGALSGYFEHIRRQGGEILFQQEVVAIDVMAQKVCGVRTDRDYIACPAIVNAAGADAARIGDLAGVPIPVQPFRRQVAILRGEIAGFGVVPFVVDYDTGWYMHMQRGGTLLLGGTDRDTRPGETEVIDSATTEAQVEIALHRVPVLSGASLVRSYVGIRPLTPDDHPILGPVPDVQGFYCACGLGGHGFMHAPAVGDLVTQWVLGLAPEWDGVEDLTINRFRQKERSSPEAIVF